MFARNVIEFSKERMDASSLSSESFSKTAFSVLRHGEFIDGAARRKHFHFSCLFTRVFIAPLIIQCQRVLFSVELDVGVARCWEHMEAFFAAIMNHFSRHINFCLSVPRDKMENDEISRSERKLMTQV